MFSLSPPLLQLSSIELQHAVIEYSDAESCFVIQDLNTAHGTYVNDCRVQNAAVRLAPGDSIRFGYTGFPHELEVEDDQVIFFVLWIINIKAIWMLFDTAMCIILKKQVVSKELVIWDQLTSVSNMSLAL